MNTIKTLCLLWLLTGLAACGGGGSSVTTAVVTVAPTTSTPATSGNGESNTAGSGQQGSNTDSGDTSSSNDGNSAGGSSGSSSDGGNTGSGDTGDSTNTDNPPHQEPVFVVDSGQNRSFPLTWLPDGSLLLGANHDNVFKVWEGRYDILKQAVTGHTDWVQAMAVTADSRLVATGGRDASLRFWGNTDGKIGGFGASQTQTGGIRALSFSPAGTFIAVAGSNGQVQVWDYSRRQLQTAWQAHEGIAYSVRYSPDGQTLASGGADGHVRLWNAFTGEKLADLGSHSGAVYQVLFSADGKQLVSAGGDGQLRRWDVAGKQLQGVLGQHDAAVYALALAADGVTLASGDVSGAIGVWRLPEVGTKSLAAKPMGAVRQMAVAGSGAIHALAFDPVYGQLAASSDDAMIRIWDAASGQLQRTMATAGTEGPPEPEEPVDYSAEISRLLAGLVFDGMKPVLATPDLLEQPGRFANALLLGLNQTTLPCTQGTYRYTFTDSGSDKQYASAGDHFAVEVAGCQEAGNAVAVSGDYALQLSSNATPTLTETEVQLNGLVVDDGSHPVTMAGALHFEVDEPADGVSAVMTDILASQLDLQVKGRGNYAFSNLTVQLQIDPVSEEQQVVYNAQLGLSGLGNSVVSQGDYAVTTLEPFKITVFDDYPYAGKLKIRYLSGGNRGQVTIVTVLDSQRVKVETDKEGNGTIEYVQEVLWRNLSSRFHAS